MYIFNFIDNYNLLSQEVPPIKTHVKSMCVNVCVCVCRREDIPVTPNSLQELDIVRFF